MDRLCQWNRIIAFPIRIVLHLLLIITNRVLGKIKVHTIIFQNEEISFVDGNTEQFFFAIVDSSQYRASSMSKRPNSRSNDIPQQVITRQNHVPHHDTDKAAIMSMLHHSVPSLSEYKVRVLHKKLDLLGTSSQPRIEMFHVFSLVFPPPIRILRPPSPT